MATVRRLQARNNVPAKICVVEDDAAVRHAMANLLEAAGFEPIGFDAGEALLAWPHVADIDVALFGVRLRGMNGFALQACVQKLEPGIPLLLISGCSDIGMERRAVQAGALALLRKPFDPAVLLQHIRHALSVGRGRPA